MYILYPFFEPFPWVFVYTFWLSLSVCFFVFLFLLHRNASKFWYDFTFFTHNIVWFFLSTFFFSRLFYVIANWFDQKFIWEKPLQFFIMSDFNFSLFWAIFWFLLVYYILSRLEKRSFERYLDGLVIAFFGVLVIGYIGAFFGGQVYGRETSFGIEILYNTHSFTPVPFQVPIFPLPLFYALMSFFIGTWLYILSLFVHIRAFIAYIGLLLFCALIFLWEFFSGKQDILSTQTVINFPQLCAIVLAVWAGYKFFHIARIQGDMSSDTSRNIYPHE